MASWRVNQGAALRSTCQALFKCERHSEYMELAVCVCTGKVRRVFLTLRKNVPRASYQEGIASLRMSWRTIAA